MSEIDKILVLGKPLPDIEEAKEHPELITPKVVETLNQMGEGIAKVGQVLTDWLNSVIPAVMEKIVEIGKNLHDWYYQAYLEDGAKYGLTDEGMYKWIDERNKESAAKAKIEAIAQREREREEMRALGRELGRKMAESGMTREEWNHRMYGFPLQN